MKELKKILKEYRKELILGPAFKMIEAVFELIIPLVMARIIDIGIKNGDLSYIFRQGGLIFLFCVVGLCSTLVCQRYAAVASQGFGTKVRSALYHHINTFSHQELNHFGSSTLVTRMTHDVMQLQSAVAMLIRLVFRAPFLVIGALFMAFTIDWKLSCIFLMITPLLALALYFILKASVPHYKTLQNMLDRISGLTKDTIGGTRVIRAFRSQEREAKVFSDASESYADTAILVGRISALLNPLTSLILNSAVIAVIWFGGLRVNTGSLTQGEIIALINYLSQILVALIVVANLVILFTRAHASMLRVSEVFETSPSLTSPVEREISKKTEGAKVSFCDVSFSYGGENALSNISFEVIEGQTVGVIGGTGSGKSTLIHLIPRFYDVTKGNVLIDGRNVRDYPLEELRQKIGMVLQHSVLFSGTIRENMCFGKPDATDEEIKEALKTAQALDFVERLPEGLDAPVEQGGQNFSGGQRQRLAIARALVRKPEILILDDSFSALDLATDAKLRAALQNHRQKQTVFMVSQRVNTLRNADVILVLDDGKLKGIGTHESLLESSLVYREICHSQKIVKEVSE